MIIYRYLSMWQFWLKAITQDFLPIVILGETISIINEQRGFDVAFTLPYPSPALLWALCVFALVMITSAVVIEITEIWIIPDEELDWRYTLQNALLFLVYGFLLLGSVMLVDPTRLISLPLLFIGFAAGFLIAGVQSDWDRRFVLRWGVGYGLGTAIGLSVGNRISLQAFEVKFLCYIIILFIFSMSIFHFGYGDYFAGDRPKFQRDK